MKDKYLEKMAEWNVNFFKNYKKMEKKIVAQLDKKGDEYFILNDCYQMLARFEPTFKKYCEICEKLGKNEGNLLHHYLHLNDMDKVVEQQKFLKNDPNYSKYKEFHKYQDSGEILENKYVSIRYDERVENIASWLFEKSGKIGRFVAKEWKGMFPPEIRIMVLDESGVASFNSELNKVYLPVKDVKKYDILNISGKIIHEVFNMISSEIISKSKFGYDKGMNSFKLLEEGYAQLIQYKFDNRDLDKIKKVDYYSRSIAIKGNFNFYEMKNKWDELFNKNKIDLYYLSLSFAFFLDNKFEDEKYKKLFFPINHMEEKSWLNYTEKYLNSKIDDLIDEWKLVLTENEALVNEVESVKLPKMCLNCKKYDYPKEKLVCSLYRYRQRELDEFECNRFDKEVSTIVIYRSKSGFVKKYAEWISEELKSDIKEYSEVSIKDLGKYRTIIYGGGLYVLGINGIKFITDNFDKFEDKNIIIFATGASTGRPEDINNIQRKNFSYEQLKKIKFFYLRGGFDFKKLKFPYTLVMRVMKWKLSRQEILTPDEQGMLDSFENPTDFTDRNNIKELVEECRK
ncbi:MAG: hypothetical protein PF638_08475 [Candidatus Delongbacteria bacterium]|jgi:menaquinone-dependent protoporphyrinogen IX oxidase|nr:hypothetical protein [Candidatus Delongbacteria bacterium]